MKRRLPTLSKSALLLSGCSAWAHPDARHYDESKRDPEDAKKRDDGIQFHDEMDRLIRTGGYRLTLRPGVMELVLKAEKWFNDELKPRCSKILSERAIAVSWSAKHVVDLHGVKGRNYPVMPGYQFGTADIVAELDTGELLVADWKTGGSEGANEQLLSLACAFQASLDRRKVRIMTIMVNEDGVWPHEREVSQDELNAHWLAMELAWEDVGRVRTTNPGIHCTQLYCPHLAYCPAISDVVRKLAAAEVVRSQEG